MKYQKAASTRLSMALDGQKECNGRLKSGGATSDSSLRPVFFFQVGLYGSCDATDKWSLTSKGSLQYKKNYCLRPQSGWSNPGNDVILVLGSRCDTTQNFFKFVPSE